MFEPNQVPLTLKQFKVKYKCVVNPCKRKVFDFKRKRQLRRKSNNTFSNTSKCMPTIGFACDICNCFNNYEKLYYVEGKVVHESCGMIMLNDKVDFITYSIW